MIGLNTVKRVFVIAGFTAFALLNGCSKSGKESESQMQQRIEIEQSLAELAEIFMQYEEMTDEDIHTLIIDYLRGNDPVFGSAFATAPLPDNPEIVQVFYNYKEGDEFPARDNTNYNFIKSLHADWYSKPYDEKRAVWSKPYNDVDGAGAEIRMRTYSLPVFDDDGELWFMVTADVLVE